VSGAVSRLTTRSGQRCRYHVRAGHPSGPGGPGDFERRGEQDEDVPASEWDPGADAAGGGRGLPVPGGLRLEWVFVGPVTAS
jgi:hypothetical protein